MVAPNNKVPVTPSGLAAWLVDKLPRERFDMMTRLRLADSFAPYLEAAMSPHGEMIGNGKKWQ
jgi:hypothetical protein